MEPVDAGVPALRAALWDEREPHRESGGCQVTPLAHSAVIAALCEEAAAHYCVTAISLVAVDHNGKRSRHAPVAHARQLAVSLARIRYGWSWPFIGRAFGIDHTTAMHALKAVQRRAPQLLTPAAQPPVEAKAWPIDGETLAQWEARMGWSREVAAE